MSNGRDSRSQLLAGRCLLATLLLTTLIEVHSAKPEKSTRQRVAGLGSPSIYGRASPLQAASQQSLAALTTIHVPSGQAVGAVAQMPPGQHAPVSHNKVGAASSASGKGGTACSCVCGDRVVWRREIYEGDVVAEKEHECEQKICPRVMVPGLKVKAQCTYYKDLSELTAGTICNCQCGDRIVWRNRAFYGDVRDKMEKECLKKICPRVNPVPGYKFYADCIYDRHLFAAPVQQPQPQPKAHAPRAVFSVGVVIAGAVAMSVIF